MTIDPLEKIKLLQTNPHCQNCGEINPRIYPGYQYTSCCNESVCDCEEKYIFSNNRIATSACCWAMAEAKFISEGVNILAEEGMRRVPINDVEY